MAYDPKTGKGLGRFYDKDHRAFKYREWKGLKDTMYDYARWIGRASCRERVSNCV